MRLTAELSLYPLNQEYIPIIKGLIAQLNAVEGLTVVTNAMSTHVNGDYELVFGAVQSALASSVEQHGKQVLVCKFIAGDLDIAG